MTQASNLSSLKIAEEQSIGVLPGSPVWYTREPNSYSEFGGEVTKVSRKFMTSDRQNRKGTNVDLDVQGGWQEDFTFSNMTALLQGFFYADAHEKPLTISLNGPQVVITSVTTDYNAASGLDVFGAGDLLFAKNFDTPANRGLKVASAAAANSVTAAGLVAEASPPDDASLTKVGFQFASGDVSIDITDGIIKLTSASDAFITALGVLVPGEYLIVGGDSAPTLFATCPRFRGRVRSGTAQDIIFDDVIVLGGGSIVDDAGATRTLHIFLGGFIRSEPDYADYVRRSYTIERTLGEGDTATQGEYVRGVIPNTFVINMQGQEKLTADLNFVGLAANYRTGEASDEIETDGATVIEPLGEDAINTSTDLKFVRLTVPDPDGSSQPILFTFASEATITIDNGAEASKALGVEGGFDAKPDNFTVTGSINAFFEKVETLQVMRDNRDLSLTIDFFEVQNQRGFIVDFPLVQLKGKPQVAIDQDIMVPLEVEGVMSKFGHTALYNYFPYVPVWLAAS